MHEPASAGHRRQSGRAVLSFLLAALGAALVTAVQDAPAAGVSLPPSDPVVRLQLAGDVAVSPSGSLFVAAPAQHEILELGAGGEFRTVAGSGRPGPGSDGPALRSDLSVPYDLAFDGRGDLYFADAGRIWVLSSSGRLAALAGNGQGAGPVPGTPGPHIANGSEALAVSLGSEPYFALGPGGTVVIDTAAQLLRLTSKATLVLSRPGGGPSGHQFPASSRPTWAYWPSTQPETSSSPGSTAGRCGGCTTALPPTSPTPGAAAATTQYCGKGREGRSTWATGLRSSESAAQSP